MTHKAHSETSVPWPFPKGRENRNGRSRGRWAERTADTLPWALLIVALGLWIASLPLVNADAIGDLGLIAALPWTMWPAFGCVIAGLILALRAKSQDRLAPIALIFMLVILLHGTPAIAYDNLRYAWAWKHLGVIEYIQRTGSLDPWSRYFDAYHNWPGFFLVFAAIGKLFGFDSLQMSQVARFFPLGLNLLYASVLPLIFRRLTSDVRLVWIATAFFVVGNWVGQDYFSPQGTVFLLLLILLALCLGPLAKIPDRPASNASVLRIGVWQLQAWVTARVPVLPRALSTPLKLAAAGTAFLLILAIIASHQLTPILMIAMLAGLFLIGRLSINFVLFACAAELLWLLFIAEPFMSRVLPALSGEFGTIGDSTFDGLVDWSAVSDGQRIVSLAGRSIVAIIAIAAVGGGLVRLSRGYRDGITALLALVPLPLAVSTSYGGEILFRIYFFALPFLSFFAAALVFPTPKSRLNLFKALALGLGLMAASAAFVVANNGKDAQYRFTASEVAAALWLYGGAEPNTLLIEGADTYPSQFQNHENLIYVPLTHELPAIGGALSSDPAGLLGDWLQSHDGPAYAIFTRSQNAYYEAMNLLGGTSLSDVIAGLLASPDLEVVFAGEDAVVFGPSRALEIGLPPETIAQERFQLDTLSGFVGLGGPSAEFSPQQAVVREEARLTQALIDAGYYDARVTIADTGSTEAQDGPELHIEAGPLYEIGTVWTTGIERTRSTELSEDIGEFLARVAGEPASRSVIDGLSNHIEWVLGQSGYPWARARLGEMRFHEQNGLVSMEIRIEPGPQAAIGTTRIEGAEDNLEADIRANVALPESEPFSIDRIDALHADLSALPTIAETRIQITENGSDAVDVVVRIEPSRRADGSRRDVLGIALFALALTFIATREAFTIITSRPNGAGSGMTKDATAAGLFALALAAYLLLRLVAI